MHFETAAKSFSEAGDSEMALKAWLKTAASSEKENAMLSAADAYTHAASFESNFAEAQKHLERSKNCYIMEGRLSQGVRAMCKFAK